MTWPLVPGPRPGERAVATSRPWVPGWWGTARLRVDRLEQLLEDVPASEVARLLGVGDATLRRYRRGESTPEGSPAGRGPLDRMAQIIGGPTVELLEFRPLEDDQPAGQATWSRCPAWCDAHELHVVHRQGLPGEVDVLSNCHRHLATFGPFTMRITRYGDADPADPWSRTFIDIDGLGARLNAAAALRDVNPEDLRALGSAIAGLRDLLDRVGAES